MRAEPPDQAAQTLARLRDDNRNPSFFAVAYVPDKTANDWNEPHSVWRIALNMGLGERPPDRVQRYEVPFNAEMRALYPYLDDYSVAYVLRFPAPSSPQQALLSPPATVPAPGEAQMIIAGAPGKMEFHWRLDGGPEQPTQAEGGPKEHPVTTPKPP
jgi:hypothetical protein